MNAKGGHHVPNAGVTLEQGGHGGTLLIQSKAVCHEAELPSSALLPFFLLAARKLTDDTANFSAIYHARAR